MVLASAIGSVADEADATRLHDAILPTVAAKRGRSSCPIAWQQWSDDVNAKVRLLAICLALGAFSGCGGTGRSIEENIDVAIDDLSRGVDSFEDAVNVLEDLKGDMDDGTYKNQVEGLIRTTGQVSQLTYEGSLDFTRTRLIEDLQNMKRRLQGNEPLPRKPVLASTDNVRIKMDDPARSTVTIVGRNLDAAASNREKYSVSVNNLRAEPRKIPSDYISYQGQYAVTVNLSKTGFPLQFFDSKILSHRLEIDRRAVERRARGTPHQTTLRPGGLRARRRVPSPVSRPDSMHGE